MVSIFGRSDALLQAKSVSANTPGGKGSKKPEATVTPQEALEYLKDFELESIAYARSFSYEVEVVRKKLEAHKKKMPLLYLLLASPWPTWAYLHKTTTPLLFWVGFSTHVVLVCLAIYRIWDQGQDLDWRISKLKSATIAFTMLADGARNLKKVWSDTGPTVPQFEWRVNDWSNKKRYALEEVRDSFIPSVELVSEMKSLAESDLL